MEIRKEKVIVDNIVLKHLLADSELKTRGYVDMLLGALGSNMHVQVLMAKECCSNVSHRM